MPDYFGPNAYQRALEENRKAQARTEANRAGFMLLVGVAALAAVVVYVIQEDSIIPNNLFAFVTSNGPLE